MSLEKQIVIGETGLLESGEEVTAKFTPAEMPLRSIVKVLYTQNLETPEVMREVYIDRIMPYAREALEMNDLRETEPTKEEISSFEKKLQTIKKIFLTNFDRLAIDVYNKGSQFETFQRLRGNEQEHQKEEPETGIWNRDRKQHNNLIFNGKLKSFVSWYVQTDSFQNTLADFQLVENFREGKASFEELEELCSYPMYEFMTNGRVHLVDEESQEQEGRLAILACANNYEARNFARFSTMVKTGLKFKKWNLIRQFTADKRRIQKYTSYAGGTAQDSYFAQLIDEQSAEKWKEEQSLFTADVFHEMEEQGIEGVPDYNPFAQVQQDLGMMVGEKRGWVSIVGTGPFDCEELTEGNFPHTNEAKIKNIRRGKFDKRLEMSAKQEFIRKKENGECYVSEKGEYVIVDPSEALLAIDQDLIEQEIKPNGEYQIPFAQAIEHNFSALDDAIIPPFNVNQALAIRFDCLAFSPPYSQRTVDIFNTGAYLNKELSLELAQLVPEVPDNLPRFYDKIENNNTYHRLFEERANHNLRTTVLKMYAYKRALQGIKIEPEDFLKLVPHDLSRF